MRRLTRSRPWTVALFVVGLVLSTAVAVASAPLVAPETAGTEADLGWARDWLAAKHFRGKHPGERVTILLSEREANLLANEVLDQFVRGRASVHLEQGRAVVLASIGLPWAPERRFINLRVVVVEDGARPKIESARLAGVPLPAVLVQAVAGQALDRADRGRVLRDFDLRPGQLALTYEWQPRILEEIGAALVTRGDLALALRYQRHLAQRVWVVPKDQPVALAELIAYLMGKAVAEPAKTDPVAVNRALIAALAAYVNGQTLRDPDDPRVEPELARRRVLLRGHEDLGRHFLSSALVAIRGNSGLSRLVGWYKELSDADGGSGFSFADMAANRAGIRFAKLATADRNEARRVQRRAAGGLVDDDFMPSIDGLPEGLAKGDYAHRFGDRLDSPAYQAMNAEIDRRIDALALYRALP
ncbi:hypothetical protein [Thioflavicoccus mobilis]|nr:hypothetical protein [Thioflavicoccus mobilis]